MNKYLWLVVGICIPLLAGFLFVELGLMPVATKSPTLPFEEWIAGTSLHKAMKGANQLPSPIEPTEDNLLKGAKIYLNQCSGCHGLPQQKDASLIAKGMFPSPPQLLLPDQGVTGDPPGHSYWVIKNGIRLTGMPGFVDGLSETELWQVSLFAHNANKLPESVQKILRQNAMGSETTK